MCRQKPTLHVMNDVLLVHIPEHQLLMPEGHLQCHTNLHSTAVVVGTSPSPIVCHGPDDVNQSTAGGEHHPCHVDLQQ